MSSSTVTDKEVDAVLESVRTGAGELTKARLVSDLASGRLAEAIHHARKLGLTFETIAEAAGLSRQRIQQIAATGKR